MYFVYSGVNEFFMNDFTDQPLGNAEILLQKEIF